MIFIMIIGKFEVIPHKELNSGHGSDMYNLRSASNFEYYWYKFVFAYS